tara:strand:- start:1121 stop:1525 length:405 start_codon:yes stop_codon:yes gene_type:complete
MILLLSSIVFAEPLMTPLEEGEEAPFAGRLLNDEAITSIITMKEFAEEQCSIQDSLDFSLKISEKQLEIDYLKAEKETLQKKHELLMQIKDNENEILRSHINPKRTMWVFFGGFIVGTASSLATYYAVNQISEN